VTQLRIHDYHAPRTTDLLNTKWERMFPVCITDDLEVTKGTSDFDVTIGDGYWFADGVVIYEDAALTDELTLDDPSTSDRIDVIYAIFAYEADTSPTEGKYYISKGTPGAVPVEPTLAATYVKIADIYIPSTASDLDDCYIHNARALRDQITASLGVSVQSSVWLSLDGDPFVTTGHPTLSLVYAAGIKNGDLWISLTGLDLYIYDSAQNQWVTSDVSVHGNTHTCGAADPLDVKDLCDVLNYLHPGTTLVHEALGISHDSLSDVSSGDHHAQDHNTRHEEGGDDELDVKDLADIQSYLHKHGEEIDTDDDSDRASAVGATHSKKAKTAALADDSTLLNALSSKQIMLMASEVFG